MFKRLCRAGDVGFDQTEGNTWETDIPHNHILERAMGTRAPKPAPRRLTCQHKYSDGVEYPVKPRGAL